MSLYLCVFSDGGEVAGMDAGAYGDFNAFRNYVVRELEGGDAGSRFPTLILHSDCDGEWGARDCARLARELSVIAGEMRRRPALDFPAPWQRNLAQTLGLEPDSALGSFIDADGEPLAGRLLALAEAAVALRQPILFQ